MMTAYKFYSLKVGNLVKRSNIIQPYVGVVTKICEANTPRRGDSMIKEKGVPYRRVYLKCGKQLILQMITRNTCGLWEKI